MTSKDYMVVLFGYERIYGFNGGGLGRVAKEISEYNLKSILESVSKIGLSLYANGYYERSNQIKLTKDIFALDRDVRVRIFNAIKRANVNEWAVFAEQPLLTLFKIALLNAKRRGGKLVYEKDVQKVGHWLLLLSDVCMGSEIKPTLVVPKTFEIEKIREFLSRQYFMMAKERLPYRIARFKDIFEKIVNLPTDFEIRQKFSEATDGIILKEYIAFCFYLLVNWVNKTTRQVDITKEWIVCKGKYFEQTKLTRQEVEEVTKLLILDVKNFRTDYERFVSELLGGNDIFPFNFLGLRKRPLVPYSNECFVCPSPYFLMDKATEGIYWIIENYLREKRDSKNRDLLPSLWGEAFERYIHEGLDYSFSKSYRKNYVYKKNEIFDGIIEGKNHVILIETKYAHWSYKAKLTGDKDDMLPTLKQLFSSDVKIKGLGQLTRGIKGINNGDIPLPFSLGGRKMIPLLIVGEGMPMDAYNRKFYEDVAKQSGAFYEHINVMPFVVLDAEETEMLEAIASTNGRDNAVVLLAQYSDLFSKRNPMGYVIKSLEFKNYLHSIGYKVPNNQRLLKKFDSIALYSRKKAFPKSS